LSRATWALKRMAASAVIRDVVPGCFLNILVILASRRNVPFAVVASDCQRVLPMHVGPPSCFSLSGLPRKFLPAVPRSTRVAGPRSLFDIRGKVGLAGAVACASAARPVPDRWPELGVPNRLVQQFLAIRRIAVDQACHPGPRNVLIASSIRAMGHPRANPRSSSQIHSIAAVVPQPRTCGPPVPYVRQRTDRLWANGHKGAPVRPR
jgi:hypothetical protein